MATGSFMSHNYSSSQSEVPRDHHTLDHLEDNIRRVIADIRPQMLHKVIENWTSRLDYIRASRGSPMPEIIFKMDGDIVLFLTLFERQAKCIGVEKTNWVWALLARMPSDITQLIARDSEDKFDNYDYIKGVVMTPLGHTLNTKINLRQRTTKSHFE
ncbi:hypothetical protein TNCV_172791 [Trichonephila clavipes]|nr:hypothetical protein TNCV_172791 [Trichonephila clavipes]